jgi:hypothetical protein
VRRARNREREREEGPDKKLFFARIRLSFLGQRVFTYVTQPAKKTFFIDFSTLTLPFIHTAERTREDEKNVPHTKMGRVS